MLSEKPQYFPLTPPQKVLMSGQLASLDRVGWRESNIISFYFTVPAPMNREALERAYWEIIRVNDSLRLKIEHHGLGLRQYVQPFEAGRLEEKEFPSEEAAKDYLRGMQRKHLIPWEADHLVWAMVARYPEGGALLVRAHHACLDGYSLSILLTQLHDCYLAFCRGEEAPRFKVGSITDYFRAREVYKRSEQHKADWRYFTHQFLHQPHYRMPGRRLSFIGDAHAVEYTLEGELYKKLTALSRDSSVSVQLLLQCAVAMTVYKLSGAYNFALGTLLHGRRDFKMRNTVGCMMTTAPVFYNIDRDMSLLDFLQAQNTQYLDSLLHGQLPFGDTLIPSYKEAILNGFNFNHCWLLYSAMDYADALGDDGFDGQIMDLPSTPFQMYLAVLERRGKGILLQLNYQKRVFKDAEAQKMVETFNEIVNAMVKHPQGTVKDIMK